MPEETVVDSLGQRAAKQLRKMADRAQAAGSATRATWTLTCSEIGEIATNGLAENIAKEIGKGCRSIYVFSLSDDCRADDARGAIMSARAEKRDGRAFPRVNATDLCAESRCLYVGSSRNTASRILQHFGLGARQTYAMHLGWWMCDLAGAVRLDVYRYGADTPDDMLPVLEDQLARELRPMLGRRGSR